MLRILNVMLTHKKNNHDIVCLLDPPNSSLIALATGWLFQNIDDMGQIL